MDSKRATVLLSLLLLLLPAPMPQGGQASVIRHGTVLPSACAQNREFFILDGAGPYWCSGANSWSLISIPSGMIGSVDTGSCPAGYVEEAAIDGMEPLATLHAHANVGTTGGSDNITPAGTVNAPTFTGSSASTSLVSGGTPTGTVTAPTFTGNAGTTGNDSDGGDAITIGMGATVAINPHTHPFTPSGTNSAPSFTGVALATHQHTVTATGTNSVPVFTGAQFDNRSSFMRLIFCKKS